jgi:hypothetical protein
MFAFTGQTPLSWNPWTGPTLRLEKSRQFYTTYCKLQCRNLGNTSVVELELEGEPESVPEPECILDRFRIQFRVFGTGAEIKLNDKSRKSQKTKKEMTILFGQQCRF